MQHRDGAVEAVLRETAVAGLFVRLLEIKMNENENNFEPLRRLLALKRNETPPPGYFDNFSSRVMSGIRARGAASRERTSVERLFNEAPWILKFLQIFEAKPAYAGGFASVLCLLLLLGIVYAQRPDVTPQALSQINDQATGLVAVAPSSLQGSTDLSNTNPAPSLQPVASFFNSQNSLAQPVNFSPSGN
jgi:hypothetical protein